MDWKLLGTTFLTIGLAELGDKTQLAAFGLSASTQKPWIIFLGAASGLILITALGVAAGNLVGRFVPPLVIKKASALLFIAIGVWTWFRP